MATQQTERLMQAGLPTVLIRMISNNEWGSPQLKMVGNPVLAALEKKYNDVLGVLEGRSVLFVFGNDSPQKELLCAKWMWALMQSRKKTGRWLTASRIPSSFGELPSGGGVVSVQGIDLLNPQQARVLAQVARDWVTEDRTLILSATSKTALEEVLGKSCLSYLNHKAVSTEVKIADPIVFKV